MNDLSFRVADRIFRLRFADVADARPLLPSYAPFYVKEHSANPLFTLDIASGRETPEGEGEEVGQFDCGGINHGVYRTPEGGYKFVIATLEGGAACALRTTADFSTCSASLFGAPETQRFGLNNALMLCFAFAGAHAGIILMHASVTMVEGRGYLFLGKSGTGKSTHSQLYRRYIAGSDLLNDDNPAVRLSPEGVPTVYGTPWSGKTPCYRQLSLPIGAFLRLQQHPENIIERESPIAGFASILSSCSTMIWDKPSYDGILSTVNAVAQRTPAYFLRCRADEEAVRTSYRAMVAPYHEK